MSSGREVLLTTDSNNSFWNVGVSDLESGSARTSYKGGTSAANTLVVLGNHYIMAAQQSKPIIQLWEVHKRDQLCLHSVTPGLVSALAVSPDGQICVGGIEDKLYVWFTATGELKSILRRHYQPVSVIKFTDDGSMFVSGGSDSLVIAWSSAEALAGSYEASGDETCSPEHVWADHSLPVTSLVVGKGGSQARVFTASLDQSCKVFDLMTGQLLLSVIFDVRVLSVAVDAVESSMFVGGQDGSIFVVNLRSPPRTLEHHLSEEERLSCVFVGHSKAVTCLATTVDGTKLVSGSEDASVKIWSVASRQCLRTLPHKGPLTNVAVIAAPRGMLDPDVAKSTRRPPVAVLSRTKEDAKVTDTFPVLPFSSLKASTKEQRRLAYAQKLVAQPHYQEGNGVEKENGVEQEISILEETPPEVPSLPLKSSVEVPEVQIKRSRYQSSVLSMLE